MIPEDVKYIWNGKVVNFSKLFLEDQDIDYGKVFFFSNKLYRPIGINKKTDTLECRELEPTLSN